MCTYPNLRARYSKGTLKLKKPLRLPDGTEVRVSVTPLNAPAPRRKTHPKPEYPTVALPPDYLKDLVGIASLGGDALADSEALYDGD